MRPNPAPTSPSSFSKVRHAHGLVFVSGEVAHTPEGKAPDGVSVQTDMVLQHLAKTLSDEGIQMSDVVQATVYLTRSDDFAAFDRVYRQHFAHPFPARTTVLATPLYPGACVEIQIVAAKRL